MGFAGTMGAGSVKDPLYSPDFESKDDFFFDDLNRRWMDYLVADEIACPRKFVCGEPLKEDEKPSVHRLERGLINAKNDANRVYTEGMIYMPFTYFVNDHRQGFREAVYPALEDLFKLPEYMNAPFFEDEEFLDHHQKISWRKEQYLRAKMRQELFPNLRPDTIIFANFNQLYKVS
jgi:hypothetical protein